jgi:two-component system OmpR family response regulator/two-component system alkaline phosphatase synthesis response regulator PhoP
MSLSVLVVEDERHIRELVSLHLGLEGFECVQVPDGLEAVRAAASRRFDLIVLDLMLPGLDGIGVCRAVRRAGINRDVPILMLTARRDESDKVLGLESGADDYLTKPFGVRELVARARALTRRPRAAPAGDDTYQPEDGAQPTTVAGIEIDPARHRVRVGGNAVELTPHEFTLLYVLATHPGIVYSREALLAKIWKGETYVTTRSVDTLVKRLRQKIEPDQSDPRYVLTVWGTGYKFADP